MTSRASVLHSAETTLADVRHAWRRLRRAPLFAAITILTLALGVGANTAIFSLVSALLLEDLPFRDPERLLAVWHDTGDGRARVPLAAAELYDR